MLPWHERGQRERQARGTQEEYNITTMMMHSSFLTLEKWFINPQTKCDSSLLPLIPKLFPASSEVFINDCCADPSLEHTRGGLGGLVVGRLDSSFLSFSLRAMWLEWVAFALIAGGGRFEKESYEGCSWICFRDIISRICNASVFLIEIHQKKCLIFLVMNIMGR